MNYTEEQLQEEKNQQEGIEPKNIIEVIDGKIFDIKKEGKKAAKNKKTYLMISAICVVFLALHYFRVLPLNNVVLIFTWIIGSLIFIAALGTEPGKYVDELEKLQYQKSYYLQIINLKQEPSNFDSLVNINVENLGDYYKMVKIHTNKSFLLSCMACIAGFVLILLGIFGLYIDNRLEGISYIVTGAGVIVELVSSLFFYLYNKTVRQLKDYHDSLLDVQNILLSFKLIETTTEVNEKSSMIKSMIEFLVGKKRS